MFDRYFSGLKLSSAAVAIVLIAAGLYFGACSSSKEDKTEKAGKTESVEVETPEQAPAETPAIKTGEGQTREGLPPEITEPCSGKNEGDPCSVTVSSGAEISGSCAMTRKNILACKPQPVIGHKKTAPGMNPSDTDQSQDQSE
jgi:hypothetical protein